MKTAIELNNMLAAIYQIASNEIRKKLTAQGVKTWKVYGFTVYDIELSTEGNNVGTLSPNLLRSTSNERIYIEMNDEYTWKPMRRYRIGLNYINDIAVFNAKDVALDRAQDGEEVGITELNYSCVKNIKDILVILDELT